MQKAVGIVITNNQDQVLLARRSRNESSEQGKWTLIGGMVDEKKDKSFEHAIVRQVTEELGARLASLALIIETNMSADDSGQEKHVKLYIGQLASEPRNMEPQYVTELKWFNKSELDNIELASYTEDDFKYLGWV